VKGVAELHVPAKLWRDLLTFPQHEDSSTYRLLPAPGRGTIGLRFPNNAGVKTMSASRLRKAVGTPLKFGVALAVLAGVGVLGSSAYEKLRDASDRAH
jgi:hypothetical protein